MIARLIARCVDDLVRILREPRDSLIGQYKKLLKDRHADLKFTPGAVRAMAELTHLRKAVARGLRAIIKRVLEPVL